MNLSVPSNFKLSLQAIRFLAASFVVILHFHAPILIGHFGVDLFFVLSGYVIAMILETAIEPKQFIKNRIIRIVPLYWLTTLAIILVLTFKPTLVPTLHFSYEFFIKSLLFIPFMQPDGVIHPTQYIGWTLNYEMLFYFLAFLSLLLARKKSQIIPLLITLILGVMLVSKLLRETSDIAKFYSDGISFEFIFGIFAYQLSQKYQGNSPIKPLWCLVAIIALFIFMILVDQLVMIPKKYLIDYRAAIFGIPSFLIIMAALFCEEKILSMPQWVKYSIYHLGEACYAIYLSHIFVLRIMDKFIEKYLPIVDFQKPLGALIVFIVAIIVGICLHNLIDKPMMNYLKSFSKSK